MASISVSTYSKSITTSTASKVGSLAASLDHGKVPSTPIYRESYQGRFYGFLGADESKYIVNSGHDHTPQSPQYYSI